MKDRNLLLGIMLGCAIIGLLRYFIGTKIYSDKPVKPTLIIEINKNGVADTTMWIYTQP